MQRDARINGQGALRSFNSFFLNSLNIRILNPIDFREATKRPPGAERRGFGAFERPFRAVFLRIFLNVLLFSRGKHVPSLAAAGAGKPSGPQPAYVLKVSLKI